MEVKIFEGSENFFKTSKKEESTEIPNTVKKILKAVKKNGDLALTKYSKKFDKIIPNSWLVPKSLLRDALSKIDKNFLQILEEAADNIMDFHERQKCSSQFDFNPDGTVLGWKVNPLDSVGIYVPGGSAIYPSSLLMNVIPAQVAGVGRIVLVSPPNNTGFPHQLVLASAAFMGVEEVYSVGGVQAIGALAYGTESIKKVVKITGPGNAYVAEAKKQVFGVVGIDSFAGPSEIMIACDRTDIPSEFIAWDLLSQAEHDPQAGAFLITTSKRQAKEVANLIKKLTPTLSRKEIIESSFANRSAIIIVNNFNETIEIINEFAPEHLELLTKNPFEDLHLIRNAGAIFLGPNSPEPVGDYFAGPNHTLPTSGCAKFSSPLGVQDFLKSSSIISYSSKKLKNQSKKIIKFAEEEGLIAHANAIRIRMEKIE